MARTWEALTPQAHCISTLASLRSTRPGHTPRKTHTDRIAEAAAALRARGITGADVAIVLGSGLGAFAEAVAAMNSFKWNKNVDVFSMHEVFVFLELR